MFEKVLSPILRVGSKILLNSPLVRSNTVISLGRFVRSCTKSNIVKIEGRKMFVHGHDGLALSIFKVYEPIQTQIVKKYVKEGDIVLDIGANVGYYTLLFAQLVGSKGRVFSFEPDPVNFDLLRKSVDLNGYQNVTLIQKAVSNKNGKLKLYIGKENRAINRIYDAGINDTKDSIEIDTIFLDDYFKDHDLKIDFVKIDVEGSESGVIEGMPLILKKSKNLKIMTEFDPFLMKKFGVDATNYIQLLLEHGFKLYDILREKGKFIPITSSESFRTTVPKEGDYTYLFCIKD